MSDAFKNLEKILCQEPDIIRPALITTFISALIDERIAAYHKLIAENPIVLVDTSGDCPTIKVTKQ